jgi:hypothetical protein
MITFKELRRRLLDEGIDASDLYGLFEEWFHLLEDSTFYVYRTDTNAVLATNIQGYDAAKAKASQLRKSLGLKFDDVKFKSERSRARGTFGISGNGRTFTNIRGERYPIEYSRNYNPSKRGRFRGYYDKHGNFHDID